MTSFVGRTINNRYRLESLLGDGGMGSVYRAYDLNLERQVALKLMHAHFARQAEFRARLVQEAKAAAQLDHPSVVSIYDFGDSEAGLLIAMEYVNGGSLRDHLRRLQRLQKYLPLSQSLQIAAQIADALDYAHRRGIIHRDVKPGNIMLKRLSRPDEPGEQPFRAMLTDFGLVKVETEPGMTQSGTTLGTPTYMSPEQCLGEPLDGRSDLYSLGVVLYELVTNRLPFTFQSLSEAVMAHNQGVTPPPASQVRPDVPPLLERILSQALAREPRERYGDGAELEEALRSAIVALEGAPTQVMAREEINILDRVEAPPAGYELRIDTPGHPTSSVPLTRAVVTLGRQADNEIVLPAEGVSRHHARLQATALGWEILDLGGINGTFLNGRRLRADDPTPVAPGDRLRIGPYELTLQGPEVAVAGLDTEPTQVGLTTAAGSEQPTLAPTEPLALFLPNDTFSVEPGQPVAVTVEVVNQSQVADRVSLQVQGLPPAWLLTPGQFVNLPPGETVQLSVSIQPPRQRGTPVGRQRFRLELVSQRQPEAELGANATLLIAPFVAFEAALEPAQLTLPGVVVVAIHNVGNATADFSVVARERAGALRFEGERGRIRLEPGQTARVELAIEGQRGGLFGGRELFPFEVEVVASTGERQVLAGEAQAGGILPPSLLYALIFIITFGCVVGALAILYYQGVLFPVATATPTTDPVAIAATETAAVETATSAAATLTAAATTVVVGPTGVQPNTVLNSAPTDLVISGTGFVEGALVSLGDFGALDTTFVSSNLLRARLPPGVPPGVYGLTVFHPDGTSYLLADALTITGPTPTPTEIPTETPTVPSATPAPTDTPLPTPTATGTPLPTPTPTDTPLPTETLPPTPTATDTPLPNPQLVCLSPPPTIDGVFNPVEWPGNPLFQFQPEGDPARLVQVFFGRDATHLYLAFLINDNTQEASDSLRLYFDTTGNSGDPDAADRFFQVGRDGTAVIQAGIGSNTDGQNWNANYSSDNWTAEVGEPVTDQWVVEMDIDAAAEMNGLADPFGMMVQVLYTGVLASLPEGANPNNANTWQAVDNTVCP